MYSFFFFFMIKLFLGYVPRYYCKELLNELEKEIQYSAMIQSLNLKSQF